MWTGYETLGNEPPVLCMPSGSDVDFIDLQAFLPGTKKVDLLNSVTAQT